MTLCTEIILNMSHKREKSVRLTLMTPLTLSSLCICVTIKELNKRRINYLPQ